MIVRNTSPSYGEPPRRRQLALLVVFLFHGLLVWMILQQRVTIPKKPQESGEMVWMKPLAALAKPVAKPQVKPAPQHAIVHVPRHPTPPPVQPPPQIVQTLPTITTPPPPPPEEDMMARIEARRKLREAQNPPTVADAPAEESDNQRAIRNAKANLANLQARAAAKDQHGGVFQIHNKTSFKAEYTFNGWNENFKRSWPRQIEVELGSERDIETAIVKSMIEVIRKERNAEFTWESHRLGRIVMLNARPEYTERLQTFLMAEFFPDYRTIAHQ